jgi:hypothetical protein
VTFADGTKLSRKHTSIVEVKYCSYLKWPKLIKSNNPVREKSQKWIYGGFLQVVINYSEKNHPVHHTS